jgi:hypothetical protein
MRVIAALLATAGLVAACSSNSKPAEPNAPAPQPAQHGALAQCLHEHGVPDSSGAVALGPPPGIDQAAWDSAMQACSTLEPGPGPAPVPGPGPGPGPGPSSSRIAGS